jgi:hypothetical protein
MILFTSAHPPPSPRLRPQPDTSSCTPSHRFIMTHI